MGLSVLVIGESGSGKSASLRSFKREEVLIFSLAKSRLPFRNNLQIVNLSNMAYSERYDYIMGTMKKWQDKCKVFVIDDSDYLMFFEQQQRNNEKGYQKYTEIALHMINLKKFIDILNDDVVVYFMNHVEMDSNTGKVKAITAGKMIDNQLGTFEAMFENVLLCTINEGRHVFMTQSDGNSTVKTAIGMFEQDEIDNDLKYVDKVIRDYYELVNPYKEEESNETV